MRYTQPLYQPVHWCGKQPFYTHFTINSVYMSGKDVFPQTYSVVYVDRKVPNLGGCYCRAENSLYYYECF
jgi:hypothetical protein